MKTIKRNKIFGNQFADIFNNDVEFTNGDKGTHFLIRSADGAVVLPITDNGRIVLIRCFRYGIGRSILMLPQGCFDEEDEFLCNTAKRELGEEIGYSTDFLVHVDDTGTAPSVLSAMASNYIAFGCRKMNAKQLSGINKDDHEYISEIVDMSLSETLSAVMRGDIEDGGSERLICKFLLSLSHVNLAEFNGKGAAFLWGAYVRSKGENGFGNPYRGHDEMTCQSNEFVDGHSFYNDRLNGFI